MAQCRAWRRQPVSRGQRWEAVEGADLYRRNLMTPLGGASGKGEREETGGISKEGGKSGSGLLYAMVMMLLDIARHMSPVNVLYAFPEEGNGD